MNIPILVSARHIHISKSDLEKLFGPTYTLGRVKELMGGQFASDTFVKIVGPKGSFEKVRVLGPCREKTQLEIAISDCYSLGIKPVIKESGNLEGSSSFRAIGPNGELELNEGCIVAKRHIHMNHEDSQKFAVKDKDLVTISLIEGERKGRFDNVLIRVDESFRLEMHIDTDEANAFDIHNGVLGEVGL